MDRHLCALLKAMSFKHLYRSTAKPANVLNTVAEQNRQSTQILPPTPQSANIPPNIQRRSRNTRSMLGGIPDPLYNLHFSPANPSTSLPFFPTGRSENTNDNIDGNNNDQEENNENPHQSSNANESNQTRIESAPATSTVGGNEADTATSSSAEVGDEAAARASSGSGGDEAGINMLGRCDESQLCTLCPFAFVSNMYSMVDTMANTMVESW